MPIIGIVTRKYISEESHNINIIYDDIERAIIKNNGIPLGITLTQNYKKLIDICDGIIFQGGDSLGDYDLETLKYLYDIDKPVLGICLGMQSMGILFNGEIVDIPKHKTTLSYAHSVIIKRNTKLYNIFKNEVIKVNSRHKSVVKDTTLDICALSQDGYIEAIEAPNKKFFIGVEWHPESMIDYDINQNKLFEYFINTCS